MQRVWSPTLKSAIMTTQAINHNQTATPLPAVRLLHVSLCALQGFAERLFGRLQGSRERWETRLDMMTVTSRCGVDCMKHLDKDITSSFFTLSIGHGDNYTSE